MAPRGPHRQEDVIEDQKGKRPERSTLPRPFLWGPGLLVSASFYHEPGTKKTCRAQLMLLLISVWEKHG